MKNEIERAFAKRQEQHEQRSVKSKRTGRECVLHFLLENKHQIWWWAWELIGKTTKGGHYLSHRAPARASDLAIHEPDLVEHRKIGRYKVYRLRVENIKKIKARLITK